ncbi:MAG TPA: cation-translocating P-type ATPase [Longimicrobiales bacterium]
MPTPQRRTQDRPRDDATPWFVLPADDALRRLDVDAARGLSASEARRRLERYGPNALVRERGVTPWLILWNQVKAPLIVVLIVAAAISLVTWYFEAARQPLPYDALVILAIVALNTLLGFVQEYRAERAVEALEELTAPGARVRRDGVERDVPADGLVPGDVLLLRAGDRVPADARLLEVSSLKADEAPLTGESVAVSKAVEALEDPDTELGDRRNMVFMGTSITYGHGVAAVVATGMSTEMGGIATLLGRAEEKTTPLQRQLARVGKQLGGVALGVSLAVVVVGLVRAGSIGPDILLRMFLFGVALAVAAVPEGLPAVVTASLALGVRRLAQRNAIVRRLPAVETLGSADVICTDKTGTITRGEMTVRRILLGADREVEITGAGYVPEGEFLSVDGDPIAPARDASLMYLLRLAALNNDARLEARTGDDAPRWTIDGDPTEGALVVAARKAGLDEVRLREEVPRAGEIPFSGERKRMTTIHEIDGVRTAVVKGAPEVVLERCSRVRDGEARRARAADGAIAPGAAGAPADREAAGADAGGTAAAGAEPAGASRAAHDDRTARPLDDATRRSILERNERFAADALRTLAIASRALPHDVSPDDADAVERELVLEGIVGMLDPPRREAGPAVAEAKRAGIRTLLLTGDHVLTARAIARQVGVAGPEAEVLAGRDVASLGERELERRVAEVAVYGRMGPAEKIRVLRALKAERRIVAMTGDGVNDAPAVKDADIGVAMGVSGTDVTREASDVVLMDDNFATMVTAIAEGRRVFDNIRAFTRYLLSANAGEVLTVFAAVMLAGVLGLAPGGGLFLPLLPAQILWINLVTDGPPALALGMSPPDPEQMRRPPRPPREPVIHRPMWVLIATVGIVIMLGTLFVLDAYLPGGLLHFMGPGAGGAEGIRYARTAAFTTLLMFEMFDVFNCLSQTESVFRSRVHRNPWLLGAVALSLGLHVAVIYWPPLRPAFDTVPLAPADWAFAAGVAASVLVAVELLKRTPLVRSGSDG